MERKVKNSFKLLQPEGLIMDSYAHLTDKVYHTLKDAHKYRKKYDWYAKADDDTFLFVDNLRNFLKTKNSSEPISYGYELKNGYHSGGAGYVMSHEAMNKIGQVLVKNYTFCPNTGIEDRDVRSCLKRLGVITGDSTDIFGKERFYPLNILDFYYGRLTTWLKQNSKNSVPIKVYTFQ